MLDGQAEAIKQSTLAHVQALERAQALIASRDPLAFQAIQAVSQPYSEPDFDPSPDAEARRIQDRNGMTAEEPDDDGLDDFTRDILNDLHQ